MTLRNHVFYSRTSKESIYYNCFFPLWSRSSNLRQWFVTRLCSHCHVYIKFHFPLTYWRRWYLQEWMVTLSVIQRWKLWIRVNFWYKNLSKVSSIGRIEIRTIYRIRYFEIIVLLSPFLDLILFVTYIGS